MGEEEKYLGGISGNSSVSSRGLSKARRIAVIWAPLAIWAGVILFLTSVPGGQLPKIQISHLDLVVHFVLYTVLGGLMLRALHATLTTARPGRIMIVAIASGVSFGLFDEIHQMWIPGRSYSNLDLVADTVGVCAGVFAYWMIGARFLKRRT